MSLPYYKMYPRDFDADENVRLMEDDELGLYLRCLNHAWENDGLPEDEDEIRRAMKCTHESFSLRWVRVSKCFPLIEGRRRNKRQEKERLKAQAKVERATSMNEKRKQGNTRLRDVNVDVIVNDESELSERKRGTRAYGSGSGSGVNTTSVENTSSTNTNYNPPAIFSRPSPKLEPSSGMNPDHDPEFIVSQVSQMYSAGGLPPPIPVQTYVAMGLARFAPEQRLRFPRYVEMCFQTGRWNSVKTTKAMRACFDSMEWDVDLTPRTMAAPETKSKVQEMLDRL